MCGLAGMPEAINPVVPSLAMGGEREERCLCLSTPPCRSPETLVERFGSPLAPLEALS